MKLKRNLVAGLVAGLAVAGGGAAIAATQLGSPKEESQAMVNDAAEQLGVQPDKLSAALKQAYKNRVDAAVKAGTLTKEHGDALKARIDSDDFPVLGVRGFGHAGHHGHGHGPFGAKLDAAATYLGLTEAELRTQLESGKTLADVAKAQGESVDGLVQALYDSAKKRLDEAVAAGKLTQAKADAMLADLKAHLTDLVTGKLPPRPERGHHDGFRGDRFGGPPPGFAPSSDAPPAFAAPTA